MFWPAAAVLIAAGLVASWSRGAWLGAAAGLAVVVALRSRTAALVAALGATLLVAAALLGSITPQIVPAPLRARLADLPSYFGAGDLLAQEVTDENFAVVERVAHWAAAQRMFERSPWIGVGAGNYATIYPQVRLPRWEEPLGHAHNLYLNTLAESGLVGMAAFVALWVTVGVCVVGALRHARRIGDGFAAALAIGVLGVLAHLAVHSLVDNLFVQGMYVQVAIWIALVQSSRFDAQG